MPIFRFSDPIYLASKAGNAPGRSTVFPDRSDSELITDSQWAPYSVRSYDAKYPNQVVRIYRHARS